MRTFHVREFFDNPQREWPCLKDELFRMQLDDGEVIETITAAVEISRKLWLVHEKYDRLPIFARHCVRTVPMSNGDISKIGSALAEDVHDIYGIDGYNREELWWFMQLNNQRLYNESIIDYPEYVRGSNSFTFDEVYFFPAVAAIRDKLMENPTALAIEKATDQAAHVIMTAPELARNAVVSDLRAKIIKMEQFLQCILVRGFNTDIDDVIYRKPITGNYYSGINDPAEALMDSTLASKAIIYQGEPLEQTEYANRKLQFSSQRVDLLIMNDCNSPVLAAIEVTPNRYSDMEGLYFKDPETGQLKALRLRDRKKYEGMTLSFRLPFNCRWRGSACVCRMCYGELAFNLPYGVNIGHVASTMTQSIISQRVLKVKHSERSTVAERININLEEKPYIDHAEAPNQIALNPELAKNGVKLILKAAVAQGVFGASKIPLLKKEHIRDDVPSSKFSQFRTVSFDLPNGEKQPLRVHVTVSRGGNYSFLTHDFLRYILDNKFPIREDGNYHIDLEKWDFTKPVFELPNKHISMRDFAAEVEVMIRSTRDSSSRHLGRLKQLTQYADPVEAMLDAHELIASKVPVSMTHVAVVLLSMTTGMDKDCVNIPKFGETLRFAKYGKILSNGSYGVLFAYQGANAVMNKLEQYLLVDRNPHLLDPILMP